MRDHFIGCYSVESSRGTTHTGSERTVVIDQWNQMQRAVVSIIASAVMHSTVGDSRSHQDEDAPRMQVHRRSYCRSVPLYCVGQQ